MLSTSIIIGSPGNQASSLLEELTAPIMVCALLEQPNKASVSCANKLTEPLPSPKRTLSTQEEDGELIRSLPRKSTEGLMEFLLGCAQDSTPRLEYIMKDVEAELRARARQDELKIEYSEAFCSNMGDDDSSKYLQAEIAEIIGSSCRSISSTTTTAQETSPSPPELLREIPASVSFYLSRNFCPYSIVRRCAEHSSDGSAGLTEEELAAFLAISAPNTRLYLRTLSHIELIEEEESKGGIKTYRLQNFVTKEWIDNIVPRFECATLDEFRSRYLNSEKPSGGSELLRELHQSFKDGRDWISANELALKFGINFKKLCTRCTPLVHQGLIEGHGAGQETRHYRLSERMKKWLQATPNLLDKRW